MTRRRIPLSKVTVAGVVIMAITCGSAITLWVDRALTAEQEKDAIAGPALSLAEEVRTACAVESNDPDRDALRAAGLCDSANATKRAIEDTPAAASDPSTRYVPVPGPRGFPGLPGVGIDGEDGRNGRDGADSTIPGPAGAPGASGADSTVPGPQGPAGPAGKDGTDGRNGTDGAPGRGLAAVTCTGGLTPITFTFTYSDGTTETVTCGELEPVPTPTETP